MHGDAVAIPLDPPPSRHFELEGALNFRDLGGYPSRDGRMVRWRTIFRSDGLDSLSPADLALLVDTLGLSSVIDLRSGDEVDMVGRGALGEKKLVLHHIPIFDETRRVAERFAEGLLMTDMYVQMAERAAPRFVRALEVIARTDAPLVFHCAAGKDRTGLLGAVLLELLGVGDDDIAEDYARSARIMPILRQRWEAKAARAAQAAQAAEGAAAAEGAEAARSAADGAGTGATTTTSNRLPVIPSGPEGRRVADELLSARPATMLALLATLRQRFGSVAEWASQHRFADADLTRLRDRLLV
jgi:protein-tyrosine phosphatase